ncbi:MAG: adventurous gliding motility protein CglF [Deltaproteobacteria bacterium]|nr:adventurous gliding motility protein CglF [Deltaproteobacteria bacterium]
MKRKSWVVLLALALVMAFAFSALAQEEEGGDSVIYKKKTVYNFDDDTITGDLTRPDQEFLTGRKLARHKSLIRIRQDFRTKVLQSVKDL